MAASRSPADTQSQQTSVTPSYRRNGKLFSCEPCRRGKLRCDHQTPTCSRCLRRNKPEQCVYHPAPLTKAKISSVPAQVPKNSLPRPAPSTITPYPAPTSNRRQSGLISPPVSSKSTQQAEQSAFKSFNSAPVENVSANPSPRTSTLTATSAESHRLPAASSFASPESNMSFREGKIGFLGPTSYSAVFHENPAAIGADIDELDDPSQLAPLPTEKIQQGADVLALLRDFPVYMTFIRRHFEAVDGMIVPRPIMEIWAEEFWNEHGKVLVDGYPDQMRSLSELVWRNTARPVPLHGQMSAREWAKASTGKGIRWEVIGFLLSGFGLDVADTSSSDPILEMLRDRYEDRAALADTIRKASEFCLCFCYECEVLNDIYVCFMYEELVLLEILKGEAHYAAWQREGELCDALIAMGLHQQQGHPDIPFWLRELRKKIFVACYGRDKVMAAFLGRPPRLSYRYCRMEMPLDLSDDELFLEGAELEAVVNSLDPNGWNTTGYLNRTTWLRVWFTHTMVREDILEIALGSADDDITLRVEQIRVKLARLNASYPDFMRIEPEEVLKRKDVQLGAGHGFARSAKFAKQINALFLLCIHAGIAHTEFLLQRALLTRKLAEYKDLIPVARRLLGLNLVALLHRDVFKDCEGDLTYIMSVHGLPAAGFLAIELLRQEQTRQFTPDILPRSETIQDLSVFISALAMIQPGNGNFSICDKGRRALKRVLDQILSPHVPATLTSSEQATFDETNWSFPTGNDADFLQWLENVEWDKGWFNPAPPTEGSGTL